MLMLEWYEGDKIGNIISTHVIPRRYIIRVIQDAYGNLMELEIVDIGDEYIKAS